MRKAIKIAAILFLLFILYLLAGAILPYRNQPEVGQEYRASFRAADCYADTQSCDRACIIEENEEALLERLRMVEQARERVILSAYEFRADESGKDMLAALLQAAERGVEVRILADGLPALLQMDRNAYFYALAEEENVEIRIYNRLNLLMPWKLMGRLHDKYVIVDDDLYLMGGRNNYDYFLGDNGYRNYDRDVLVYSTDPDNEESSIRQLEAYFQSVWEGEDCKVFGNPYGRLMEKKMEEARAELVERYAEMKKGYRVLEDPPDYEGMTFAVNKITLLSNPIHVNSKEPAVFYALAELMKHGEGEIRIHTPYIICNDWMYESFREICEGNPDVALMTNSAANNGNPFGASDYLLNKGKLVDTGLTIYEYEGGVSYHGKSISIGNRLAIIGSFNMDMRSAYLNTELMLVIDSQEVTGQLKAHMQSYEEASAKVLDEENYEVPEGVRRQEIRREDAWVIKVLEFFNWFRFLM